MIVRSCLSYTPWRIRKVWPPLKIRRWREKLLGGSDSQGLFYSVLDIMVSKKLTWIESQCYLKFEGTDGSCVVFLSAIFWPSTAGIHSGWSHRWCQLNLCVIYVFENWHVFLQNPTQTVSHSDASAMGSG